MAAAHLLGGQHTSMLAQSFAAERSASEGGGRAAGDLARTAPGQAQVEAPQQQPAVLPPRRQTADGAGEGKGRGMTALRPQPGKLTSLLQGLLQSPGATATGTGTPHQPSVISLASAAAPLPAAGSSGASKPCKAERMPATTTSEAAVDIGSRVAVAGGALCLNQLGLGAAGAGAASAQQPGENDKRCMTPSSGSGSGAGTPALFPAPPPLAYSPSTPASRVSKLPPPPPGPPPPPPCRITFWRSSESVL